MVIDTTSEVTSKYPKISVQERLNAFFDQEDALVKEYREKREEISENTELADEAKAQALTDFEIPFMEKYNAANEKVFTENKDNLVAVFALRNIRSEYSDEQVDSLLNLLSANLQEHKYVKGMKDGNIVKNNIYQTSNIRDIIDILNEFKEGLNGTR